jgi:NadR type nicotinamide-nucleotide adenylyltransferase
VQSSAEIKKIVIIGPESTGKSTLCEQLAQHYKTQWVPEYAREYLLKLGKHYSYDDLLPIAKGQVELEEQFARSNPGLLFIDTDLYVMQVWSEFVFGKCHQYIIDQVAVRKYHLYLLCDTDLPWKKDELREYPELETREKLFHIYKNILVNQATPWSLIRGSNEERLIKAIRAVEDKILHPPY